MSAGWGIVGTGAVAHGFAKALRATGATRIGVASSDKTKADAFAREHGFATGFDDVAALAADPRVDVVYVASATRLHRDHALAVSAADKALLLEKPFTGDPAEAEQVVAAARAAGVFCMEAMWLRFSSVVAGLRCELDAGRIGDVREGRIALGYAKTPDQLGDRKGALPVFGCYGLSLAWHLFGAPQTVRSEVKRIAGGIDGDVDVTLEYPGFTFTVECSVTRTLSNSLELTGTRGLAGIADNAIDPTGYHVGGLSKALAPLNRVLPGARANKGSGFRNEIAEVERCLAGDLIESTVMPLDQTVAIQRLMAEIAAG